MEAMSAGPMNGRNARGPRVRPSMDARPAETVLSDQPVALTRRHCLVGGDLNRVKAATVWRRGRGDYSAASRMLARMVSRSKSMASRPAGVSKRQ